VAIEAYKIYIELVTEAPLGPINDLLRTMAQVQKVQQGIQTGLNDMAAGLRGSTRMAENLARAMQSVATATKEAATAARAIRLPVGGGAAGIGGASVPARASGTTYSDTSRAASTAQLLLTGPRQTGAGFSLNGPAYGPSTALIPAGPRIDRTDVYGSSPNRGALVPISGAGGSGGRGGNYGPGVTQGDPYEPPRGGPPTVYVPPASADAPDEPYNRRMTINPNPPKGGKGISPMHAVAAVATTAFAGEMLYQTAKTLLDPAFQVQQEAIRVAAETRQSPTDVQSVIRSAFEQQRTIPGTNVVGNLEAFRMLFSLTQNQAEAEKLLPSFLPVGTALQAFNPGTSYDQQLESVFKGAEFMGAVSRTDPKTGKSVVDATGAQRVAKMLLDFETVSNGAVDPDKFLAFLRAGGTAAANIDPAQIPFLLPVIQSLNPRGAGQGLKSFEQQFSSGKMSQGVLEMLTEMGIVKNPADVRKIGIGQFMLKPGALDEKLMMQAIVNPIDFYNQSLLPDVDKYLTKEYGKIFTGADVKNKHILESQVLQQISSRIPGGTLLGELLRTAPLSVRDAQAVKNASAFDVAGTLNQSPITQIAAFTGALNALLAVFAAPALKGALTGIGALTAAMNALTKAGQGHPKIMADAATVAGQAAEVGGVALAARVARLAATKLGMTGLARGVGITSAVGIGSARGAGIAELLIAKEAGGYLADAALNTSFGNRAMNATAGGMRAVDRFLGLQDFDRWFYNHVAKPIDSLYGGPAAIRGAPPPPIATRSNPLPVTVMNGKDLMQSVDAHNAKQMSLPPSSQTGASFGAAPAWAGRPGFAP
jgi:hypothetical protein